MNWDNPCDCWMQLLNHSYCKKCLSRLGSALYPRTCFFSLDSKPLIALSQYNEAMKTFVYSLKSASFQGLMPAQRNFLKELLHYWKDELLGLGVSGVCVVPGHPLRSFFKTDLAWELARISSRELGLPLPESLLKRQLFKGDTMWQSQKKKTRRQRLGYLKDHPFYMPPLKREKSKQKYLLIDDVCASSSSLMACAQTLENNGYNVSAFLVLSRVELEQEAHYPSSRVADLDNHRHPTEGFYGRRI